MRANLDAGPRSKTGDRIIAVAPFRHTPTDRNVTEPIGKRGFSWLVAQQQD